MKRRLLTILLLLLAGVLVLAGCQEPESYDGMVKVVFELEGGTYRNSNLAVTFYYNFEEGTQNLILPLASPKFQDKSTRGELTNAGYELEGWYQTKTVTKDGDKEIVEYSDKWDFDNDKVGSDGVTLYARWEKVASRFYGVYYNSGEEDVLLGSYPATEHGTFSDYSGYAKTRIGYTPIGFFDADGNAWDESFTYPDGDVSEVKVYVQYIEGRFSVVHTVEELKAAKSDNIYLMADIDCNGEKLNFGDYNKKFVGNGHTISNFEVNYSADRNSLRVDPTDESKMSLFISLFGDADGAEISDVTFGDVTVNVETRLSTTYRIYVAPISVIMKNTKVSNVNFYATYTVTRLPNNFDRENLVLVTDAAYYEAEGCTVENVELHVTDATQTEAEE